MRKYQVALIVSVKASSYEEALAEVSDAVDGIGYLTVHDYDKVEVIHDFEEDDLGQRVMYLDSIDDAEEEETEDEDEENAA